MGQINTVLSKLFLILSLAVSSSVVAAAESLMPFVLGAENSSATVTEAATEVEKALKKNGFDVVGKYSPDAKKSVVVVTNSQLKKLAAMSKNGGFGAMQRVAITSKGGKVNVSYTNPTYLWNA